MVIVTVGAAAQLVYSPLPVGTSFKQLVGVLVAGTGLTAAPFTRRPSVFTELFPSTTGRVLDTRVAVGRWSLARLLAVLTPFVTPKACQQHQCIAGGSYSMLIRSDANH